MGRWRGAVTCDLGWSGKSLGFCVRNVEHCQSSAQSSFLDLEKHLNAGVNMGTLFGYIINVTGVSTRAMFFFQLILRAECFGCSSKSVSKYAAEILL